MEDIDDLGHVWSSMSADIHDLEERCEQYAEWTLPHICPREETKHSEQTRGNVAIGARLVNHLSNRVVDTMFPSDRPFFRLPLSAEAQERLTAENADEQKIAEFTAEVRKATTAAEQAGMRKLNVTKYRPVAVLAVQHLCITGNAMINRHDDDTRTVYGIKDFRAKRDMKGQLVKAILRDGKKFSTLPEELQMALKEKKSKDYLPETPVTLYTYFYWEDNRWHRIQGVDNVIVMSTKRSYVKKDFPLIDLVWNLSRGEDYGRGLVEDYSVTFHNVDVTTLAMIDLIGIAADFKFLVNPSSQIDIEEWNDAARGAYMPGMKDDISVPDFPKRMEISIMAEAIAKWERELAQAFLMNSAAVRDAERVTAEEIRFYARELESAFGGLYSRLALEWQQREAEYLVSQIDFGDDADISIFDVVVTTGLESLSREGELDNLRLAIADLQMLDAVPEELRGTINPQKLAEFVFGNRGVKTTDFLYTQAELQQQQAARQQQEQAALDAQTNAAVAQEAGKAAVKQ